MPQPLPSERIKAIVPVISERRIRKAQDAKFAKGDFTVLSDGQIAMGIAQLNTDPMTWVMAVLTFLDEATQEAERPSTRLRPDVVQDGNVFIACYGPNLQDGVSGCGDTPEEALVDFDREWVERRAKAK